MYKRQVYEASWQYQLYVDDMQPDGVGALNLAYEQLLSLIHSCFGNAAPGRNFKELFTVSQQPTDLLKKFTLLP